MSVFFELVLPGQMESLEEISGVVGQEPIHQLQSLGILGTRHRLGGEMAKRKSRQSEVQVK